MPGQKLADIYVNTKSFEASVHGNLSCDTCHSGISGFPHQKEQIRPVQCGTCHSNALKAYKTSSHAISLVLNKNSQTKPVKTSAAGPPTCVSCHGKHNILKGDNPQSPVYPLNQVKTCGGCHQKNAFMTGRKILGERLGQYVDSVHGRALTGAGLVTTAVCSSCHEAHKILPSSDLRSSVSRTRATETCGKCHVGIVKKSKDDVHTVASAKWGGSSAAVCTDCHTSHNIQRVREGFHFVVPNRCGQCHAKEEESYRRSMHGKAVALHSKRAPDCSSCHLAHESKTGTWLREKPERLQAICMKCHEGASLGMTSFQPHANPNNKEAYPVLYWTQFAMHALLISVLGFFAIHTALWFPRSWLLTRGDIQPKQGVKYYYRFDRKARITHIVVVISFVGLALTGIPLRFSHTEWAQWLSSVTVFASREVAGGFHRFFAIMTFGYAIFHLVELWRQARATGSLRVFFLGPDSMIPKPLDVVQLWQHLRYFVGLGPRPHFERWTYWEKFDYWAVFWGVIVIGSSGLLLWHPAFFTLFLPGWVLNVAEIIHSEEALLAVTFIFFVHFYHNTMRREKFPMDTVMVTGKMSEEEFLHDHPAEYRRLRSEGLLADREAPPPTELEIYVARIVLGTALALGLMVVFAVVFSFLWS